MSRDAGEGIVKQGAGGTWSGAVTVAVRIEALASIFSKQQTDEGFETFLEFSFEKSASEERETGAAEDCWVGHSLVRKFCAILAGSLPTEIFQ